MDARPLLVEVARALRLAKLEAVLIGNAAAALRGVPLTTLDLDFLFRKTTGSVAKLRRVADELSATVMRPFYPASDLYRIVRDEDGLQLDFMARIHGPRSYEGLRDRAGVITIDGESLRVAAPQSWSVPVKRKRPNRRQPLVALAKEADRAEGDMIRRWQALAPAKRTNFLRRRVGLRATAR